MPEQGGIRLERKTVIIRTSILGVVANLFLAGFKAAVGLLSHSIAIVLDAVNNLSDALSSVITIAGTRMAGKKPDKKHPYGHGRAEYLTAAVIAVIVLYAGVSSLVESVKKILEPVTPDYSAAALIIVGVAVLVKLVLSVYVKKTGQRVRSDALIASGQDARNDAVISAATLAAAAVFLIWGLSVEAWLGALISLVILKSGYDILRQTISRILGERVDSELSLGIKRTVSEFPQVQGAYDLILHSYGPDMMIGSVHIEVPDFMTAADLDQLERDITDRVALEHGVILTGISVYSVNTTDDNVARTREDIRRRVMGRDHVLQMHGFHMHDREIRFDLVIGFEAEDRKALFASICREIREAYPDYQVYITMDSDISD
ncbi:MAG: cation transporter [Oscillospiraceae bacterium]|nr:cation transporter [Oscillospiraceae bacterium]MBR4194518.1 cation transporter [Oscillospiraceae bacterium]